MESTKDAEEKRTRMGARGGTGEVEVTETGLYLALLLQTALRR